MRRTSLRIAPLTDQRCLAIRVRYRCRHYQANRRSGSVVRRDEQFRLQVCGPFAHALKDGSGAAPWGASTDQSSFKPSANDTAAPASFIFRAVNRAIRSPMLLLGTVWRLSKFAAQVFGRPSSSVNTTSVGMLRIVEVIGAMVTEFSTPIAESRVIISTGRFLSGALKVYQQISPRFTMRPNPAH